MIPLLRRPVAECGVDDGHPTGLPCRAEPSRRVAFGCPNCGQRSRDVCDHHATVLAKAGEAACEVCAQAGDHNVPVTYHHSSPIE